MPKTTLLDQAKAVEIRRQNIAPLGDEFLELTLAYMNGEVGASQVAKVLGCSTASNVYARMGTAIRNAIRNGQLTLTRKAETFESHGG